VKITIVPPEGLGAEPLFFSAEAYSIGGDRINMHQVTVLSAEAEGAWYHAMSVPVPNCVVFVKLEAGESR
jgi:hypothetical protein